MSTDSLVGLMEKYKDDYYQTQGKKSFFFKKTQKMDCAKELSHEFKLDDMIHNTVYQLPNTNKIIFNYSIFKLYANPENYDAIVQGVLNVYDKVLTEFSSFEGHIMLESFTISAAERYKSVIQLFCTKCMNSSTKYSQLTTAMHIYNTPSMIESISILLRPFIDSNVNDRIILHSKSESCELIRMLLSYNPSENLG